MHTAPDFLCSTVEKDLRIILAHRMCSRQQFHIDAKIKVALQEKYG